MKRTCTHCGKEIDAANTFCPYCGMKTEAPEQKEDTRTDGMEVATAMAVEQPGQRKPGKTKAGILTAVFAAVCLCVFLYIRSLPVTIDLNDYAALSVDGYDGHASAHVSFDEESFNEDVLAAMRQKGTDRLLEGSGAEDTIFNSQLFGDFMISSFASEAVSWDLNKWDGISNGDVIELTFKYDNGMLKRFKICLKGETIKLTAEGLPEITVFDPFEDLNVTFSGISSRGSVEVTGGDPEMRYSADHHDYLSNGDVVTVKAVYKNGNEEAFIRSRGRAASTLEKQYKVKGLPEYVRSFEQLTDSFLEALDSKSKELILKSFEENGFIDSSFFGGAERIGMYLLTAKKWSSYGDKNRLTLVYKVHYKGKEEKDYFYPVTFTDILAIADGKLSTDLTDLEVPYGNASRSAFWGTYGDTYEIEQDVLVIGYADMDQVYNRYVAKYADRFDHAEKMEEE